MQTEGRQSRLQQPGDPCHGEERPGCSVASSAVLLSPHWSSSRLWMGDPAKAHEASFAKLYSYQYGTAAGWGTSPVTYVVSNFADCTIFKAFYQPYPGWALELFAINGFY